jgi:hypothetical protein
MICKIAKTETIAATKVLFIDKKKLTITLFKLNIVINIPNKPTKEARPKYALPPKNILIVNSGNRK